ncbi:MAG: Rieske (2Fe-2S) protein [Nocardioidaceae bacterium]
MAELDTTTSDAHGLDGADTQGSSGLDRRTMLKGLAVAGATVPFLAACGSDDSGGTDTPKSPGSSSGGPTSSGSGGGDVIVKASDVPVGGGVIVAQKDIVVTQPTKGTFEGFSSTCTHQGCTVTSVSNGTINCPCHGSMYSIKDAKVVGGPAPQPLASKPVKEDGGNIVPA